MTAQSGTSSRQAVLGETMDQLWWTSFGGSYGVRAASPGLQDDRRFQRIEPFVKYALPSAASIHDLGAESAPVTLALIATGNERVLVNKVFLEQDDAGRVGIVFSHLIAGLPDDFLAVDAIRLWRSTFWKKSDSSIPRGEHTLPVVSREGLQAWSALDEWELRRELKRALQDPVLRSALTFLIQVVLGGEPSRRIYIAAPCDEVALLLSGLTLCLPRRLQRALTFSTFESDVTVAFTRIVGTCQIGPHGPGMDKKFDILASCYRSGYVVNCYLPRMSALGPEEQAYGELARFAVEQLADDGAALDQLLGIAEELALDRPEGVLTLARILPPPARATSIGTEELDLILRSTTVARALLPQEEVQDALLTLVARDSAWWNAGRRERLARLGADRTLEPVLRQIARRAVAQAETELLQDRVEPACRLLDELAPIDPQTAAEAVATLLLALSEASGDRLPAAYFSWKVTSFMLVRGARDPGCQADSVAARVLPRWLPGSWQDLQKVLQLGLPRDLAVACLTRTLLRSAGIPADVGSLIDQHVDLFADAMQAALTDTQGVARVRRLLDALRSQNCRSRAQLVARLPPEAYGGHSLPSISVEEGRAGQDPSSDRVSGYFQPAGPSRSEALRIVKDFCHDPVLERRELRRLAAGVRVLAQDGGRLREMRASLVGVIVDAAESRYEIEDVLETLGEVLAGSPDALLRLMIYSLDSSASSNPAVLAPYVELALDDRARCWHSHESAPVEERADLVRPLLTANLVERLDREARRWSEETRENWEMVTNDLRLPPHEGIARKLTAPLRGSLARVAQVPGHFQPRSRPGAGGSVRQTGAHVTLASPYEETTTRYIAFLHLRVDAILGRDEVERYAEEDYAVELVSRYLTHLQISEPLILRIEHTEAETEAERLAVTQALDRVLRDRLPGRFVRSAENARLRRISAVDRRLDLIVLRWD